MLYAPDAAAAGAFYRDVLGLRLVGAASADACVLRISPTSVLLIFRPERAAQMNRGVPAHGSADGRVGRGHVAFFVEDLDAWPARLADAGVEIEMAVAWDRPHAPGARSIYIRDPAGNSVELINKDIWPA